VLKVSVITLGCDKNTVDSERYVAQLADRGAEYTMDMSEADVIVDRVAELHHSPRVSYLHAAHRRAPGMRRAHRAASPALAVPA
jgi:tRNA A37 methylthiotransferase MiaB